MVLALGAVFAPLFILLGLQGGIIGNMLDELQKDPVSRLVTPKWETSLDDAWLADLRKQTAALIGSPTAFLLLDVEGKSDPVNVLPTSSLDPLLKENKITLTSWKDELVLSTPLANVLRKKPGDSITLTLIRSTGQEERRSVDMKVAGVLPVEAGQDSKIWLDTRLFKALHQWRRGGAISELGLPGGGTILSPEYDGIMTLLKRVPSDEEYRTMIGRGLGFSQMPEPFDMTPWGYPPGQQARLWKPVNSRVLEDNFTSLINRHHEMGFTHITALPYIDEFKVNVQAQGKSILLRLSSLLPKEKMVITQRDDDGLCRTIDFLDEFMGNTSSTQCRPAETISIDIDNTARDVWVSYNDEISFLFPTAEMTFSTTTGGEKLIIPVRVHPSDNVPQGFIAADPELAGKMNAARRQDAMYDPQTGEFRPVERGVRFFR
ncbi:MAG: hypothetical protein D3906_15295, partial [Candidatus Electrothrix sp. AUS1_2]|nr:hypothetical protein [Candidatus Electrothrix sp. AUS1_2]